jgi:hypothetical protein
MPKVFLKLETSPLLKSSCTLYRRISGEPFTTPAPTFYIAVSATEFLKTYSESLFPGGGGWGVLDIFIIFSRTILSQENLSRKWQH